MSDLLGLELGYQTLIGVDLSKPFPLEYGNCMSMLANDNKCYRIVNFYIENLEKLIELGIGGIILDIVIHAVLMNY